MHTSRSRFHWHINTDRHRMCKCRACTVRHRSQRLAVWIAGIHYPGSIAPENGQHGIEYVDRLLEVFGVLNSLVNPVHTLQKPETVLPHCVGAITFDDDFVVWFHKNALLRPHIVGRKASFW